MLTALLSLLLLVAQAIAKIYYAGVCESGGEFGVYSSTGTVGTGLPGQFGVDYAFINKSTVDIFVDQDKINLFRVAFLLERMCPLEYGLGAKFNETHFEYYKDAINYITRTKGAYAILDPHNYMRYNNPSQQPESGSIIGNSSDLTAATTAQFEAFWRELAHRFKDNKKVIFEIMNEPHDMPTALVLQNNQAAITGIRNAGAQQLILAPGNAYDGGESWCQNAEGQEPSADELYKMQDPLNNTAIDIHEYLDSDFSGQHAACSQPAAANMACLTQWLQTYQLKAMVTEFGGGNNTNCYNYIDELITYLDLNDEYIGWSAWAAGPLWDVYSPCCTDGARYGSLEPGSTAADGEPGLYYTVWQRAIEQLVPADLVRHGMSSVNG
ncbi:hypothetical protein MMC13_005787 [Lambiella insularis]|nr:hypothetical protein [Lambiella insularis]